MDLQPNQIPLDDELALSSVWAIPDGFEPSSGTGLILGHES